MATLVADSTNASAGSAGTGATDQRLDTTGLLVLVLGSFLPVLSFFIVNVALPAIGEDLHASAAGLQLVIGCFGVTYAALVVLGGRIGDAWGRRRLYRIGMAGFAVTAVASAAAPTLTTLLVARTAQGVCAALVSPQVLATITATRSGPDRVRGIGVFGAAAGLAAAVGQVIGGWLVSADLVGLGWRSTFLVAVPVALVGLALVGRTVPETRSEQRLPLDLPGAGLLALLLSLVLVSLSEGRPLHWPVWIWVMLLAGLPVGYVLLRYQTRAERAGRTPLLPPSLFGLRAIRLGSALAVVFFSGFGGFMFAFALATQEGAHLSPLRAGLALGPFAAGFLLMALVGPVLQRRWGGRVLSWGLVVGAAGYALVTLDVALSWPHLTVTGLAGPLAVVGLGNGLLMMPLIGVIVGQVPPEQSGLASGLMLTLQQTCLALGAAAVGTLYVGLAAGPLGADGAVEVVGVILAVTSLLAVPLALGLARRQD